MRQKIIISGPAYTGKSELSRIIAGTKRAVYLGSIAEWQLALATAKKPLKWLVFDGATADPEKFVDIKSIRARKPYHELQSKIKMPSLIFIFQSHVPVKVKGYKTFHLTRRIDL